MPGGIPVNDAPSRKIIESRMASSWASSSTARTALGGSPCSRSPGSHSQCQSATGYFTVRGPDDVACLLDGFRPHISVQISDSKLGCVQPSGNLWLTLNRYRDTPSAIEHPDRGDAVLVPGSGESLLHLLKELRQQ